jgi:hypothetical protein
MKIQRYKKFFEDAETAGKLEIEKISLKDAIKFCDKQNYDVLKEIPDFEKHFKAAQDKAKKGWTRRHDMPVIEDEDVKKIQARLEQGTIDIYKPLAKETPKNNPFPTGLSGLSANKWLTAGLRDGQKKR